MFEGYGERIRVLEFALNKPVTQTVDIALCDTFAQGDADSDYIDVLVQNPHALRVVVYTWRFQERLIDVALEKGASGYLSKTLPAGELVGALERIDRGEIVISPAAGKIHTTVGLDWPGRTEGLGDREAEIVALITQGKSNAEIAALTFLSPNTVKSYIRSAYRKIGVTSRTLAVIWGIEHGFKPDHKRIDTWRQHA